MKKIYKNIKITRPYPIELGTNECVYCIPEYFEVEVPYYVDDGDEIEIFGLSDEVSND